MALCATTALAGAVPRLCVRGARGLFGGLGPVPGVASLSVSPSRPACSALRVAGRPVRVSLTLARWYAIPRGLCVPRARSGCPSGSPRLPLSCVCARAPAASAPPPSGWCGVRTSRGPGTGRWQGRSTWSVPLRVSCPVPCSVWRAWGGAVRSRFPPTWLGVVGVAVGRPRGGCLLLLRGASGVRRSPSPDCSPTGRAVGVRDLRVVGAGVRVWGPFSVPSACTPRGGCAPRGGSVAFVCRGAAGGGPVGRGVALPRSVPLPSLGRQQSGCHWRRAVHGGRGPPYHSGSCSPASSGRDLCGVLARWRGLACSPRPPWEPAAGHWGGSRSGSSLGWGREHPPCLGGWGPGPLRLAGRWGGGAAGRAAASLLPFWVAACGTQSWPPSCRRRTPLRRARAVRVAVPPRGGGG